MRNKLYVLIITVLSLTIILLICIPNEIKTECVYITTNKPASRENTFVHKQENSVTTFTTSEAEVSSFITTNFLCDVYVSDSITEPNKHLLEIADAYFNVSYAGIELPSLIPLAIANVETGSRADHTITWSSLFPSKYVDIDLMDSIDVTTVISDSTIYNALSKEYSTRDRGPLQMSPSYGTGLAEFDVLMGISEKDKLKNVSDTKYSNWINGASSYPGDRFSIKDCCLRLSASFTKASQLMKQNGFEPVSDRHLFILCTMHHQQSGIWSKQYKGSWKSSEKAYEYSTFLCSDEFITAVEDFIAKNPKLITISEVQALDICRLAGIPDFTTYCSKRVVAMYPVKSLFAYIKLQRLYGGIDEN